MWATVSRLASGPSCPGFNSQRSQNFFRGRNVDVAEINQRCCLEESEQCLENANRTYLVLANGKTKKSRNQNITHRKVAPPAVKPCDPVVALDLFPALGALGRRVALDPVVQHPLGRPRRLDVRRNARRWRPLDAPLVNCVLAN